MNSERRVFYVIYVEGEVLADCLDAIRVLSRPREKCRSHITVRGPYKRRLGSTSILRKGRGAEVFLCGADNFFDSQQNTVFLRCSAPRLAEVWYKPDFPEFNPHLTLYDGDSPAFARRLFDVVSKYEFGISFRTHGLKAFVSVGGQSSFSLAAHFNSTHLSAIVLDDLTPAVIANLDNEKRLTLIDRICKHLSQLGKRSDVDWGKLTWRDWQRLVGPAGS